MPPPRPELGDFAVGCFALAKARGPEPGRGREQLADAFAPTELLACGAAAGPFVNFRANRAAVFRWLFGAALDRTPGRSLLPRTLGAGKTICIDYSSPNISKHLAYHHIRSTMIGHALVQIFRALGYSVVGINHLGDWGTTHGMLLAAWKKWAPDPGAPVDIGGSTTCTCATRPRRRKTRRSRPRAAPGSSGSRTATPTRARCGSGSATSRSAEFQTAYDILGMTFDEVKGESEYQPDMPRVLAELAAKGLSSESEGALVVQLPDEKVPLLLKKSDGATLYATRDIPPPSSAGTPSTSRARCTWSIAASRCTSASCSRRSR